MSERLPGIAPPEGRWTDRAFALTVLTFVLLTPPIITIFDIPGTLFGIPILHVYCFGIWLVSIAAGGLLSARLTYGRKASDPLGPSGGAGPDGA